MSTDVRTIEVLPAQHRCNPNPKQDYGCTSPRIRWTLHDGNDAIAWTLFTGWGMPADAFFLACPTCPRPKHQRGMPPAPATAGSVDWHMSTPVLGPDHYRHEHCLVLDGPCYPDVGYLIGDELFDLLRVEGDEAVWSKMHELLVSYRAEVAS